MERLVNFRLILFIAVSFCLGIFCAFLFLFSSIFYGIILSILFVTALVLYFIPYKRGDKLKIKAVFSFLLVLFFVFGAFNFNFAIKDFEKADLNGHAYSVVGKVKEIANTDLGIRVLLGDIEVDGNVKGKLKYNAYLYLSKDTNIEMGKVISFNTSFSDNKLIYEGRFSATTLLRKIKYTATLYEEEVKIIDNRPNIFEKTNLFIKNTLSNGLSGDEFGVAYALLTGHSEFMGDDTLTSYRKAGVAHIFAVSGLHIGFLATAIGFLLAKFRVNRLLRVIIIFPILLFYSGVCGFSASSIRATIMVTVSLLVAITGERYDGLTSIAISALIVLIYSPVQLFYVGFQLSFTVVLGMMILSKPISRLLHFLPNKLATVLSTVLSAQVSAIPISLYAFGWFSFISIIANLVFIPIVSAIFVILIISVLIGGAFNIATIVLFPVKYVLMLVNYCITILDYDIFIVGGFTLSVFSVFYYVAIIIASDIINFRKIAKIVSILLSVVICLVGTVWVNFKEYNTTKAYVIGTGTISATMIYTPSENTLIVSDLNYVFNISRLKRINNFGITKIDNVILMNGYNVDAQVFLTKLRTCFALDKVFYYGEKNENQENIIDKSFPEIKMYSFFDEKLPINSFECAYLYDGRILDCEIEDKSVLIFSVPSLDKPFVNTDKNYDLIIGGKLYERIFAVYSAKHKISYRRSITNTDAETNGNLTYKFDQ